MELIRRKTDYGIRALALMSQKKPGTFFQAGEISRAAKIPEEFLYKIFRKLIKAGLIKAARGPRGGFALTKQPSQITTGELVEILQGPLAVNRCFLRSKPCPHSTGCRLKSEWQKMEEEMGQILDRTTLAELSRKFIKEARDESQKKDRPDRRRKL